MFIRGGGYHENHAWTFFRSSVFVNVCVFNVWPQTTLLLPVWPGDAKRLDTPDLKEALDGSSGVSKLSASSLSRFGSIAK